LRSQKIQCTQQKSGSGGPVHVVIPIDKYRFGIVDCSQQAIDSLRHAAHKIWIVKVFVGRS
jgi:hypothetical protein